MSERYILSLFNVPYDASEYDLMVLVQQFVHVVSVSTDNYGTAYAEFKNKNDLDIARKNLHGFVWNGTHVLYAKS